LSPAQSPLPKFRTPQRPPSRKQFSSSKLSGASQRSPLNRKLLTFEFDRILPEGSTQHDVNQMIASNAAIQTAMKGRDYSVFVTGPMSLQLLSGLDGSVGIIVSCFESLIEIATRSPEAPMLEIAYSAIGIDASSEKVLDLLCEMKELQVKDNFKGYFEVIDRKYTTVESSDDVSFVNSFHSSDHVQSFAISGILNLTPVKIRGCLLFINLRSISPFPEDRFDTSVSFIFLRK
jgi:hypothetical protein